MKYNHKGLLLSLSVIVFAGLTYSCSPASDKLIAQPIVDYGKIDVKSDSVSATPVVDLLFIVDNSGSMSTHQRNLAANVDIFLNAFSKMSVDYHIGVISTDMDKSQGELIEACVGYDMWGDCNKTSGYKYITNTTPNALKYLKDMILIGTDGSATEAVFDPMAKALSVDFLKPGGINQGFLRDNAYFAVIFITDAEDQSEINNAKMMFDMLIDKKEKKRNVLSYGIIVPTGDKTCPRDDSKTPLEIESFLGMTINAGKNIMSLCDYQFGQKLADFTKDMSKYLTGTIKLNRVPVVATIRVFFGTQEIKPGIRDGWYYDPKENTITIGDDVVMDDKQPVGTTVVVNFTPIIFPN